jgi:hypothetical protein
MRIIGECHHWQSLRAVPYALPDMPALPLDRVTRLRPFKCVSIDYLGPTVTRAEHGTRKAWVVLPFPHAFARTRAVHLEAVPDMTTCTLVNVFRQFVAQMFNDFTRKRSSIISRRN